MEKISESSVFTYISANPASNISIKFVISWYLGISKISIIGVRNIVLLLIFNLFPDGPDQLKSVSIVH